MSRPCCSLARAALGIGRAAGRRAAGAGPSAAALRATHTPDPATALIAASITHIRTRLTASPIRFRPGIVALLLCRRRRQHVADRVDAPAAAAADHHER